MKVSMYTPAFFSIDDGGRNFVFQLGQALVKNGINVVLFTFTKAFEAFPSLLSEGVITLEGVTIRKYEPKIMRIVGMRPQFFSRQLIKDISHDPTDIVHVHDFSQFPLLISVLRKVKSTVVLSPHKINEHFQNISSPFRKRLLKGTVNYIGKKVSRFIVDNPQDKSILMSMETPEEKITLIQHGIDYLKMASIKRNEEDIILTVGRYAPNKGLHNLMDAARVIIDNYYPQLKFYLVGTVFDKEYHKLLQEKIRGFEDQIYLTGPLEEAKLINLFSRAKFFIFPSVNDTHGLVSLEAMAAGVPVIATKVEGTSSLIQDGFNGILIPPDDVSSLVDSILDLLKNKEKRELLIKKGKETAKKYYWQEYTRGAIRIYSEIVENKSKQ